MSIRRSGVLLMKELARGPRSFIFIFAVVIPIVFSLVVSLLFGTLLSGKPRLGVASAGPSQLITNAGELDSVRLRTYESAAALEEATRSGAVDVGLVLPADFDALVRQGDVASLTVYIWGESLMKNRLILGSTVAALVREVAGQESPVEIVTTTLGSGTSIPWADRLLPFVVLIAIIIGGIMVPASSLVDEKQKRTLGALTITPATLGDVYVAKGGVGFIVSLVMGVVILVINNAFGANPALLVLALALSALISSVFGVLLGALMKDINTLFATIKGIGILLYAPAIIYLFPGLPQWIGRVFPTYYMIDPVVEITQRGGGWIDVAPDLAVLLGLTALLIMLVGVVSRQRQLQPA